MSTLIIIDMQVGMTWPAADVRNNHQAEAVIAKLLNTWRERKAPIVHVRHISRTPGSPFWPGQPGVEFQPALVPLDHEHVVEKNVPDAFINTGLERWLHARGESSVVIVGVSTNNSVESTARTAGNLGFKTYVVSDGTYAYAQADFNGVQRSAENVHAMALANLHGEYATVIHSTAPEIHPTPSPADIVSAQLAAYNARDIATFAALYAEDACLYRMPHSELMLRGRQQIIDYYGGTAFQNTSLHAEVLSRQVIGNKVVDHERAVGIRPEPVEFMAVYEVHDGLIQAVWFYDPHQASTSPDKA